MLRVCFDPYSGSVGQYSAREIVLNAAAAGFEGLNIPTRPGFVDTPEDLKEVARIMEDHNLGADSLSAGPHITTTPGKEEEFRARLPFNLEVAHHFGARVIGFWPCLPEGVERQAALDTLKRNLDAVCDQIRDAGCIIALEFEKKAALNSYELTQEFAAPYEGLVQATVDTYHVNDTGADPYQCPVDLKGQIADVHLSGTDRGEPGGPKDEFDYRAFARGLKEIGFQGPLVTQYNCTELASMCRAAAFARRFRDEYMA